MVRELQQGDPQAIGPYRLVGRLGQGGMGQVFLGVSPGGRPVAVKAIRPDLASDPQFRARFAREVAAARKVSGVYTATVIDAEVDGPVAWLATAYVTGPSLAEAVDEYGPLPGASLLTLAAGLAESLSAIHAAGVTHRDLKPSNVLLAEDGPRVIDFGISRAAESTALTQTGMTIGSPGFMSPEQAVGGQVGPASDIFSLGAVLAFAATGQGPFGSGTTITLLYRVVHETPDLRMVPGEMRPLIENCLVKDPARRPTAVGVLAGVGALQPTGNWLPDTVTRMAVAAPIPTALAAAATPPAPAVPVTTPVPGLAVTQTAMAGSAVTQPDAGGPGGLAALGLLSAGGEPPRRRRLRPLVLGPVIGVLVVAGAATAFALSSHSAHPPSQLNSRPAAQVSSAASTTRAATSSPPATSKPTARASASSHPATQPTGTTAPATSATTAAPTHTATTSPTPTPTTTSPTPTPTTTSPTPTPTTPTPTTPTPTTPTSAPPTSSSPPATASNSPPASTST